MNTAAVKASSLRSPIEAFAEHLAEQFHMSAERALDRVNRELKANPLTNDIQLQLPPTDTTEARPTR